MNKVVLLFLFLSASLTAQVNTEIHVFDIVKKNRQIKLLNGRNISQNRGYDNQPSFYDNDKVLFSYSRKGFTDIVLYDLELRQKITGNIRTLH